MVSRILAFFVLLLSVLFMPFWVSAILALAGLFFFPFYVEAVILCLLSDVLFGTKESAGHPLFLSFIICAIALIAVEIVKTQLKFYRKREK